MQREFIGSILDAGLLERILSEFEVDLIFHLAALLSTRSEFTPIRAHEVNVEGTLVLLEFAQKEAESHGRPVTFLYPSSIAAYGLPDLETKRSAGRVSEDEFNHPTTMYGANKLYCELLGNYYARHYKQLAAETLSGKVDFRCVRFPGLISAMTMPSGGTSDYAPEMIHAAARGEPLRVLRPARHADSVHGDARRRRGAAPARAARRRRRSRARPTTSTAFNPSAEEIRDVVRAEFPSAAITFEVDAKRQGIVDSWPADVDDSAGAARLGVPAGATTFDRGFSRIPDPHDPEALPVSRRDPPIDDRHRDHARPGGPEVLRAARAPGAGASRRARC